MAGRSASKSPAPPVRRSSRQSTPGQHQAPASPPPSSSTRSRQSMPVSASTPSLASLLAPSSNGTVPTSPGREGGMRKSASTRALSPRIAARVQRPQLPHDKANKQMTEGKSPRVHKVKTQTLHLGEGAGTITIARVKCPVPKGVPGHIIKRFDTNAISASSLFRAAFPFATTDEELTEMRWIAVGSRGQYGDTAAAGLEDDETKKLSGTWIPATYALALAEEYGVSRFTADLVEFTEEGRSADQPETPEPAATEADDSPALRSPRAKRARVASPLAGKTQALSGATGPGVSILQTLERTDSGTVTETTEVKIDVPVPSSSSGAAAAADGDEAPAFDEAGAAQIAEAQKLVESLKKDGTLAELSESTHIPEPAAAAASSSSSSKKRALEEDEDALPREGTLADALVVDNRSFLSKLFRRNQKKRTPVQAARETRALPASSSGRAAPEIVVREEDEQGEGRRWAAGLGLAVAVGATAAAPYLFG
ncbi:hypothetical protein JCM6882_002802 [Rhodosporidiobolus microsporus]